MKKKIIRIVAAALLVALVIGGGFLYFGPDRCPLCDFIKSNAPCLVNVATGEVEEMALYTPHEKLVGEIAEEQTDSTELKNKNLTNYLPYLEQLYQHNLIIYNYHQFLS